MSETSLSGLDPQQLRDLLSVAKEPDALGSAEKGVSSGMSPRLGSWIDQYKLSERLGEGGMAIVYLAEQEYPVHRKVAIKIIKPGMNSAKVIARFEAERQTLTLFNHPNIAQIYDAGTTKDCLPYFVMEYVKGLPITEYCDHHKLTIEERLRLFQQVCHAVQHAHQNGIIHRDIKPSNIIVSMQDDRALPKIIDFGIAKAIDQPFSERTLVTEDSQLLGTPEYMSPEQADMAATNIDTRTDVYSLGVLLYVLLAGVLPFEPEKLRDSGIENIRKVIRETDPNTPSTRLTKLGGKAIIIAQNRWTEIRTLTRHLRRELEWIPLKAMRKERSQRYRSASELSDDIDNYLKGEPLLAGPLTAGYRLKKFIRRHKALVAGITVVVVVSLIGVVTSMVFAVKADHAREDAQVIAYFLENDVLGSVEIAKVGEATVSFVLDAASERLEGKFEDRPLVEASIHRTLAGTYRSLGELQKAERHQLDAFRIYKQCYDEDHPTTRDVLIWLGWIYEDQGRYSEMEALATRLDSKGQTAVAHYYLGKYQDAASYLEGHLPTADESARPFGACNLSRIYAAQGRYKEAEQLFLETLSDWPRKSRKWKLFYSSALADMYRDQGRYDESERLFEKTLEAQRLDNGNEHVHTLETICGLARLYIDQNRREEAENLLNEALPIAHRRFRKNHPLTLRFVNARAVLDTINKRYEQAEKLFDESLKGMQLELGDYHPHTLETKNDLAILYKEQGDYEKAEPLLIEAIEGRLLKLSDTHPHTIESIKSLIALYETQNKPEKAQEWQAKLTLK